MKEGVFAYNNNPHGYIFAAREFVKGDCHDQEESLDVTGTGRYKALHNEKVHGGTVY